MSTKSSRRGTATFQGEVTNITALGFWLLVEDREYFVPFSQYPVFQTARIEEIIAVEQVGPGQYHWPSLDADIELEALEAPERFPLVWQV